MLDLKFNKKHVVCVYGQHFAVSEHRQYTVPSLYYISEYTHNRYMA